LGTRGTWRQGGLRQEGGDSGGGDVEKGGYMGKRGGA
jgi:hypothetical protein